MSMLRKGVNRSLVIMQATYDDQAAAKDDIPLGKSSG
jgi:hypothetical protein